MPKHHYVPRLYLEGFVDPNSRRAKNPYLWVVDLQHDTVRKRSPKNVGKLSGYYDWEDQDLDLPSVEALYSALESKAAPVLRKLSSCLFVLNAQARVALRCRQALPLSNWERFHLSRFVGFQICRGPGFRRTAQEVLVRQGQTHIDGLLQDEELLSSYLARHRPQASTLGPEDMAEAREWLSNAKDRVSPNADYILQLGIHSGEEFSKLIFVSKWVLLRASRHGSFFTTDEPAALLTPDARPRPIDFDAGTSPELEIAFPVSRNRMLLFHQTALSARVARMNPGRVDQLMSRSHLPTMQRYAFCSSQEDARRILEARRGYVRWPKH